MNSLIFLIITQLCLLTQAANETHYVGAVVEFSPTVGDVSTNAERFQTFIQNAKKQNADIIVFPEIGLNGYGPCTDEQLTQVPHPVEKSNPCDTPTDRFSKAFKKISCAAKDNQIYVVINVAEIFPCDTPGRFDCPEKGVLKYNTNVVFDRQGTVIARYRKYHLFGEDGTNSTYVPDLAYFDTDFGVRFGTFICFDILFEDPATLLLRSIGIEHFVYSTAWFSELPFLTAVQAQQGWAYANNVTFLASGYNDPAVGSGGSGIYNGRNGALVRTFPEEDTSLLLVADVSKNGETQGTTPKVGKTAQAMYLKRDNLEAYISLPISNLKTIQLCHEQLCCQFFVDFTPPSEQMSYHYRGLVFDGVRSFDGAATGGVQVCAITTCSNNSLTSCGERVIPKHSFSSIKITGKFRAKNSVQIPSTLVQQDQLLPLDSNQFTYSSECDSTECAITMELTAAQDNLLTFGIYGRDFTKDGQPPTIPPTFNAATTYPRFFLSFMIASLTVNKLL